MEVGIVVDQTGEILDTIGRFVCLDEAVAETKDDLVRPVVIGMVSQDLAITVEGRRKVGDWLDTGLVSETADPVVETGVVIGACGEIVGLGDLPEGLCLAKQEIGASGIVRRHVPKHLFDLVDLTHPIVVDLQPNFIGLFSGQARDKHFGRSGRGAREVVTAHFGQRFIGTVPKGHSVGVLASLFVLSEGRLLKRQSEQTSCQYEADVPLRTPHHLGTSLSGWRDNFLPHRASTRLPRASIASHRRRQKTSCPR